MEWEFWKESKGQLSAMYREQCNISIVLEAKILT